MLHYKLNLLEAVLLLFCACADPAATSQNSRESTTPDPVKTEEPAAAGKNLFTEKCVSCHGDDGTAGILGAANLQQTKMDVSAMQLIISNGKGNMPPFKATFSEEEIKMLVQYIQTLDPNFKTQ